MQKIKEAKKEHVFYFLYKKTKKLKKWREIQVKLLHNVVKCCKMVEIKDKPCSQAT